jgi:hypothetical protein
MSSFKDDLIKARSYIVFIIGLLLAFTLVYFIEKQSPVTSGTSHSGVIQPLVTIRNSTNIPPIPAPRALNEEEMAWAKTAWKYFENNTRPETGLCNSVDGYTASTLWDTSSYLLAIISAERLGIISSKEFDLRIEKALSALEKMPLFNDVLPNKSYSTISLKMVDYGNNESATGIGWSAIDIGRALVPINILVWHYPQHTEAARKVVARWKFEEMLKNSELYGALREKDGTIKLLQEGRLGYEQYAAKTFTLLGLDATEALNYRRNLSFIDIYGVELPIDTRDPARFGAQNFVVSEPYVLDGLEFGFDATSRELAWRVFSAQQMRYKQTGILTAVSEDHVDGPPYFVYNTVYSGGRKWAAITEDGKDASAFRSVSIKAAFGWHALYRTSYTSQLIGLVSNLRNPTKGWHTGRYERTGKENASINANTNAIILESLAYIQHGSLLGLSTESIRP